MSSGNSAPRNTIATFDHSPMPNHSINSGKKTSRGVALNAVMNGSNMALSTLERPTRMPSGKPTTMAMSSPMANAVALTPSGAHSEPDTIICHSLPAIWLGTVKNSRVPALSGTKYGTICQTRSSTTKLMVAQALGSMRRHRLRRGASSAPPSAATRASRVCVSAIAFVPKPHCPTRHGNAARSAQRIPSVSTTAITITTRMQANMRSIEKMSPNREMA